MKDAIASPCDTSAPRAAALGRPRVSVVITNCNYGHLLSGCIESVLGQTWLPDELVVVDDASTDASAEVLAAYSDRADVVRLERNRGQAAAFNAGFARASGDYVIFLDADDMLRPEAIDVLLAHAAPELALVFFGLETVDADGRSTGIHHNSLEADDGDNRPRLLRSGVNGGEFRFAPTSGNLFSRRFLNWALPMPEESWRICADAYLVRAAALWGPSRAVRRVLGAYRVHGGNNYLRSDNFDRWTMQRGERDLKIAAAALFSLADAPKLAAVEPEAGYLRLALRRRALEMLASVVVWTGDAAELRRRARGAIPASLCSLPAAEGIVATAQLVSLAKAGAKSAALEELGRSGGWSEITSAGSASAAARLEEKLKQFERPRWLEPLGYDRVIDFRKPGSGRRMLAEGWASDVPAEKHWSRGNAAALEFSLEPALGQILFELTICVDEANEGDVAFSVSSGSRRLWRGRFRQRGAAQFTLDRDAYKSEQPVRLEIRCEAERAPRFTLESLIAWERPPLAASPFLQPGISVPAGAVLGGEPAESGWTVEADGSATMRGGEARLCLSVAPGVAPIDLVVGLHEFVPAGSLTITVEDVEVFAGRTGGTAALVVPLVDERPRAAEIALAFAFSTSDPAGDDLGIESVGLVERAPAGGRADALRFRSRACPALNVGEVVRFGIGGSGQRLLTRGWRTPGESGVRNLAPEASLRFRVPPGLRAPTLRLAMRPVLPALDRHRHVVGVSAGGVMLTSFELLGPGEVTVDLGETVPGGGGEMTLTLHSIYAPHEADSAAGAEVQEAVLELASLGLEGESDQWQPVVDAQDATYARPTFLRLVEEAGAAVDREPIDRLLERRAAIAGAIWDSDQRGIELLVFRPDRLRTLERLGGATLGAPLCDVEQAIVARATSLSAASDDPRDRLRVLAVSFLLLPAFKLPFAVDLATLPAILVRSPELASVYLGRAPEFDSVDEVSAYVRYLERLLASVEAILDRHAPGSAMYSLAFRVMWDLWSTKAIFGRDNLLSQIRARSRCIEKILTHAGAPLAQRSRARAAAQVLRVGVMVRHLAPSPEAWALLGMYRHVDRSRLDLTLITTHARDGELPTGDIFARRLALAGLAEDEAVRAIRALDLDVFILGAYTAKLERVSTIVAHRLARIQASACFNCPTTLGFQSFDYAFAWSGIEAADAQGQHVERLVCIDAAMQCCFDFTGVPAASSAEASEVRREIGVPEDAVLLACGAMAHKILPDLMRAWAGILARSENAWLVLYPFASCWAMPYSAEIVRRRLRRQLEAAGVAPERALIVDELSPERVHRVLAASDVYLDSFPYTGATTVCEALACGLPVVTRAGEMLREQTGAAWLRAYGLPQLVARSREEYIDIAARLATSAEGRAEAAAQVARVLATGRPPHADLEKFGAALSDLIWRTAEASGLFPGLRATQPGVPSATASSKLKRRADGPRPAVPVAAAATAPAVVTGRPARAGAVRVVVLTVPRSGSTALCRLLGECERAEMHFELFHATEIQYRTGPVSDAEALAARDAQPVAFMDRTLVEGEARGARLVGFKFFAFHKKRVLRRIAEDESFKIVCLSRSNTLAQYSSRRIAEATDQWELGPGEAPDRRRITFDPADFEAFEAAMQGWSGLIAQHLAESGRQALFVEYKSMLTEAGIARLSDFLGIPIPTDLRLPMVRQNAVRTIDRFSNPESVRQYLDLRRKPSWAYGG